MISPRLRMVGLLLLLVTMLCGCVGIPGLTGMNDPLNQWLTSQRSQTIKRDMAEFQEAQRLNDLKPANNAIAVANNSSRLAWGAADSAATEDQAQTLALQKCQEQAKVKYIVNPCKVHTVNGRYVFNDPDRK